MCIAEVWMSVERVLHGMDGEVPRSGMVLDLGAMPHRHVGSGVWGIWDGGVMGWRSTDLAEEDARQQAAELNVTFNQYGQRDHADRREVSPPIEVESVTWSAAGDLDYLVKERQEWSGRVRLPDRHHVWIRAVDLCEAKAHIDRSFKPPLMRPSLWYWPSGYIVVGIIVALLTNNIHLSSLSGILLSILAVLLWPFILGAALCRLLGFHIPGIDIT